MCFLKYFDEMFLDNFDRISLNYIDELYENVLKACVLTYLFEWLRNSDELFENIWLHVCLKKLIEKRNDKMTHILGSQIILPCLKQ